jgi:hypothetical protein
MLNEPNSDVLSGQRILGCADADFATPPERYSTAA